MGIVAVITNPNAKRNRKERDRFEKLESIVGNDGIVLETPIPEDIQPVADALVKKNIDLLCICGGDGTMQHTLSAFIRAYDGAFPPAFLPLRGGTMNTIGKNVGLKGSAEENLARIMDRWRKKVPFETVRRDLMCVNDKYCFLFGIGVVANFLDVYYSGNYDGVRQAIDVIIKAIPSIIFKIGMYDDLFRRVKLRVTVDGDPVPIFDYLGVLAATVAEVGVGFKPLYRAEEQDGTYHILFSGFRPIDLLKELHRFYLGKPLQSKPFFDTLAQHTIIESDETFRYMADGEIYQDKKLEITVGPPIRIVRG